MTASTQLLALSKTNAAAKRVMESWANAEWFTKRPGVPETIKVKVFKVEGEINTDDFSPAGDAWSRPDIPLHALAMGKTRFPGRLKDIAALARCRLSGRLYRRCCRYRFFPQIRLQQRSLAYGP